MCEKRKPEIPRNGKSYSIRIDLDEEENNIRNSVNVNYLVMVAITVMFAVVISWRLTMTYFPRTTTWIWSMTTSLSSRIWTWLLHRGHREQAQGERFVSESEEEVDLKKCTYTEEFGGKFEMVVYNIEYDRMFIVPAVCPGGSKEEDIDMNFVYYKLEDGK